MDMVVPVDIASAASRLSGALRVALAAVIVAALAVDLWLLDGSGTRASYLAVAAIAALGLAGVAWPRTLFAVAVAAPSVSLLQTVSVSGSELPFAFFTEFVVLPALFGAVVARRSSVRWPIALLVAVAGLGVSWRVETLAIRSILGASMSVLLGAAAAVVVYARLGDRERRSGIEAARQNERLDLARELHDIVGHHVTGIVVLAQASRFTDEHDPHSSTARALADIEAAGLETLTSVRRLVGLLRTEPTTTTDPGLADIELLVSDLRSTHPLAELIVADDLTTRWVPDDLATTVQRLAQEAATNVRRHGDPAAPVRFTLRRTARAVELTVDNRMQRSTLGTGYGLIGMRERVDALSGTFSAGPEGDERWAMSASLPLEATPGNLAS